MNDTGKDVKHNFSLLIRRMVFGVLITGLFASVGTLIPLYYFVQNNNEKMGLVQASAQAVAIQNQLDHYHTIAKQFASRTQIRQLLAQYNQNQLTLAQVSTETQRRIRDAAQFIPELAAGFRISADGELVAQYQGPSEISLATGAVDVSKLNNRGLHYYLDDTSAGIDRVFISAAANIVDNSNGTIGIDLLLFDTSEILKIIRALNRFGQTTRFRLVNAVEQIYIEFHDATGTIQLNSLSKDEQFQIMAYGKDAFIYPSNSGQDKAHIQYFVPFYESDWGLIVVSPKPAIAPLLVQEFVWVSLIILLVIALGTLFVRKLVRGILKKQLEQQVLLQQSMSKLRLANTVFEKASEAIVITDARLNIVRVNPAAATLFQLTPVIMKQGSLLDFVDSSRMPDGIQEDIRAVIVRNDSWQGEIWYQVDKNQSFPALQSITAVRNTEGKAIQLIHIFNDISTEKKREESLSRLALTDPLTHLPNRHAFLEYVEAAIANSNSTGCGFAIIFLDLDKFKPINDIHGHDVGDALLQAVGPRVREVIRASDVISRLGGDEFVVLIDKLENKAAIETVATAIIKVLKRPIRIAGVTVEIGSSLGVAFYPEHGSSAAELLKVADEAMYESKKRGGDSYSVAKL